MKRVWVVLGMIGLVLASAAAMPTTQAERQFAAYQECASGSACISIVGPPSIESNFKEAISATTEVFAAQTGLRHFITGVSISNEAATVQTVDLVSADTGGSCANPVALTHKFQMGTNATTTSPIVISVSFQTAIVGPVGKAICVRPSQATNFGATVTGYVAP